MEEPDKAVKIEKNDMQVASAGYEYETLMRLMGSASVSICWISTLPLSGQMNFIIN